MRVLVDKQALIDKLVANRENHRAVFLKALDNFKKAATEKFEANLDRLRSGKMPELYITFSVPTDETRQYDSAISLLRLATEDRVELNESDHQKYVLDQWEWTKQWKATSNAYGHVVADDDEPAE